MIHAGTLDFTGFTSSTRRLLTGLAATAMLLSFGCDDSTVPDGGGSPIAGLHVDTVVNPGTVLLGNSFTVACPVTDVTGALVDRPTGFTVLPTTAAMAGGQVTPLASGLYTVTCGLADGSLPDPTPAVVLALSDAELARVRIETTLDKTQAAIGEEVHGTCEVSLDGAILSGVETHLAPTPTDGITVSGHTLVGSVDADYQIACGLSGTQVVDDTPAALRVGKGNAPAARVTTKLSKSPAAAGESVGVVCTVTDASGAVLDQLTVVGVVPNSGVGVDDHSLSPQQVGTYEVACDLGGDHAPIEKVPATLEVVAGPPVTVEARSLPEKLAYAPGETVTIAWTTTDAFGNVIPDAPATVSLVAGTAGNVITKPDHQFEMKADGIYTFQVTLTAAPGVTDTVDVAVDSTGPLVVITSPLRGLTRTGDPVILVEGEVHDAQGGVASLTVNGKQAPFDAATGQWQVTVDSAHGLNVVVAEAADVYGNTGKATVAWLYSTAYQPVAKPGASIDNIIRVWLSKAIIDDFDHTEPKIDDLGHLLEALLSTVDIAELVGKPALFTQTFPNVVSQDVGGIHVQGDMKLWAEIGSIQFGTVKLNLIPRNGGLDVKAEFAPEAPQPGLLVELNVFISFDLKASTEIDTGFALIPVSAALKPPPTAKTTTRFTINRLGMDTSFDISAPGGQLLIKGKKLALTPQGIALDPLPALQVDLGTVVFDVAGFDVLQFPLGVIDLSSLVSGLSQLVGNLLNPILDTIVPLLTGLLEPFIADFGGQLIGDALKSLELDVPLSLNLLEGMPPAEIDLQARISDVAFTTAGATIGLGGAATAAKKVDADPLGSLLRDACNQTQTTSFTLPKQGPMELAVGLDLLNEVLFSFWYGGSLSLSLDLGKLADLSSFGVGQADLTLAPLLPPVITDCNAKGTLKLQLGDAFVSASMDFAGVPVTFDGWLHLEVDAGIVGAGNTLGIVINGVTLFELEITSTTGPFEGLEGNLEALVESLLVDQLLPKLLGDSLSAIPIPEFDLSNLVPGGPAATLSLDGLSVTKKAGFIQLEGSLSAE